MRFGNLNGRLALIDGTRALDVSKAGLFCGDPLEALERWPAFREWAATASWEQAEPFQPGDLGAPVPRPPQVFAVGINYRPHAAEAGYEPPAEPVVFTKFPSCVTGPYPTVELPEGKVDWEAELVAVVGTGGRSIPQDRAWDAIAGLTIGQDLSERVVQMAAKPAQFSLGKSFPGFGPTGPVVVTPDELADPDDLAIEGLLNGSTVQRARTSEMIFSIPRLVAYLSAICPLLPGDLIFTGTPGGVGNRMTPPRYLTPGDELITRVEGLGEIRQLFR